MATYLYFPSRASGSSLNWCLLPPNLLDGDRRVSWSRAAVAAGSALIRWQGSTQQRSRWPCRYRSLKAINLEDVPMFHFTSETTGANMYRRNQCLFKKGKSTYSGCKLIPFFLPICTYSRRRSERKDNGRRKPSAIRTDRRRMDLDSRPGC